jgi:hypothetical protein
MNFDDLIECTRCGSDACYKQEVNQEITLEMCFGCGFQHNSAITNCNSITYFHIYSGNTPI